MRGNGESGTSHGFEFSLASIALHAYFFSDMPSDRERHISTGWFLERNHSFPPSMLNGALAQKQKGGLAMKLDVPFYSQRVGLFRPPPIDDPNGCWYACAKMIGTYHEGTWASVRRGVPELTNPDGTHRALGLLPDGRDGYSELLKNEKLEELVSSSNPSIDDLTALLQGHGPILFFWWSVNYVTKAGFYHASVMVGTMSGGGLREIIFHDPAIGPNQTMSVNTLQSLRQTGSGRQALVARIKSTIPEKKVNTTGPRGISYAS